MRIAPDGALSPRARERARVRGARSDDAAHIGAPHPNPLPASGERGRRASARASGQAQQSFTDDVALDLRRAAGDGFGNPVEIVVSPRSEEHTSELQSLM